MKNPQSLNNLIDEKSDGGTAITSKELSDYGNLNKIKDIINDISKLKKNPEFLKLIKQGFNDYLKNKKIDENSPKEDILAYQILENLNGIKTNITGKLDKKLKQKNGNNEKINQKLNSALEKIKINENTPHINELIQQITSTFIKEFTKELKENGKIGLDPESIYNTINELLSNTDENLDANNPLKGTLKILKENYFIPKEKGINLIRMSMEGVSDIMSNKNNEKPIDINDFNSINEILISSVGTLIDISKTPGSEKKINTLIDELTSIDRIKAFLKDYPDVEKTIRTILPKTLNGLDKDKVTSGLKEFFNQNEQLLLEIINAKDSNQIVDIDKKRLLITNNFIRLFDNVIDNKTLSGLLQEVKELNGVQNNIIASKLINAINNPNIPENKKNEILKDVKEFAILATDPNAKEEGLTSILDKCIGHTAYLLSIQAISEDDMVKILSKALNIDPQKEIQLLPPNNPGFKGFHDNYIKPIISGIGNKISNGYDKIKDKLGLGEDKSSSDSEKTKSTNELEISNYSKLLELAWNNKTNIIGITKDMFEKGFKTYEDLIRYLIKEKIIEKSLQANNNQIIANLKQAINFSIKDGIDKAKTTLLETKQEMISTIKENQSNEKGTTQEKGKQLFETIQYEIFDNMHLKLEESLSSGEGKSQISKSDITKFLTQTAKKVLYNHQDKLIELAQSYGMKLDNPKDQSQMISIVDQISSHPDFQKLMNSIVDNILNKIDPNKDILTQISQIVEEIKTKGPAAFDNKTIQTGLAISVDTLEKQIDNPNTLSFILNNIPGLKEKLPPNLSKTDIIQTLKVLKQSNFLKVLAKNLSKELGNKNLFKQDLTSVLTSSLGSKLINQTIQDPNVNKKAILDHIEKSTLLQKSEKTGKLKLNDKFITKENISNTLDIAFSMINSSSPEQTSNILNRIGLDKIFGNTAYTIIKDLNDFGCKDKIKTILNNNQEFLKDAINGKLNKNKLREIIDQLYETIPSNKRLNVVDTLVSSGFLHQIIKPLKEKHKKSYEILNPQIVDNLSNIVFNSIQNGNKQHTSQIIENFLSMYGIKDILNQKYLGETIGENIFDILNIIGKEGFKQFLNDNTSAINQLYLDKSNSTKLVSQLGIDLIRRLDGQKLQQTYSNNELSSGEKLIIKYFDNIKGSISGFSNIDRLMKNTSEVKKMFDSKNITNINQIKEYGNDLFELGKSLFTQLNNKEFLKDLNNLIKDSNGTDQKISKLVSSIFIKNNLGFCSETFFSQFFGIVFGKGIDKAQALINYFSNNKNKDNFEKTLMDFFVKYCNK